ncbi:MAG: prepilin-type N-terminal cleavage/methylation domain-containing protein, partial [Thermodesulfobacteriota bacterium]
MKKLVPAILSGEPDKKKGLTVGMTKEKNWIPAQNTAGMTDNDVVDSFSSSPGVPMLKHGSGEGRVRGKRMKTKEKTPSPHSSPQRGEEVKTKGHVSVSSSPQRDPGRVRGAIKDAGFTLVEVLIGLALAAIVMSAIYSLYTIFYKQSACQYLKLEAQQNSRAALEMIQTELLMAGYMVASADESILNGTSGTSVIFRYIDADNNKIEVRYELSGINLNKVRCVRTGLWTDACSTTFPNTDQPVTVMDNLDTNGLAFNYFKSDGTAAAFDTSANRKLIRFVKVAIEAEAREKCAGQTAKDKVKMQTEVRLRNLETESGQADTTPPTAVGWLKVREAVTSAGRAGVCGRLALQFEENLTEDLSYYRITYRRDGIEQESSVNVPVSSTTGTGTGTLAYTLSPGTDAITGLLPTKSTDVSPNTYVVGIRAVDTSNNASSISEVTGAAGLTLATSISSFGGADNDTTINPSKPQGAAGFTTAFTGVDGSSDGWVNLSWTYDTAANPDVVGYRVYRGNSDFAAPYPISSGGIAAETDVYGAANQLIASQGTYTDKTTGLIGCQTYYYAITPVNCDDTLISDDAGDTDAKRYVSTDYGVTYGDGVATVAVDFPTAGVSDTAPTDTVGIGSNPGDPSPYPYPVLSANAGWKRVSMGLTNPYLSGVAELDKDFSHTYIAFNKRRSGDGCSTDVNCTIGCCYPVDITKDGAVSLTLGSGGTGGLIPNYENPDSTTGKFTVPGQRANFFVSSESVVAAFPPTLSNLCEVTAGDGNPCTYYFKAISFDKCGNKSAVAVPAQILSTLCGDDPGNPFSPGVPAGFIVRGCAGAQLEWNDLSSIIDFAGYAVYRNTAASLCETDSCVLTGTTDYPAALPVNTIYDYPNPYWPDPANCPWGCNKPYIADTVAEGASYYYFVRSMDCAYANDPLGDSSSPSDGNYIDFAANISGAASVGPVFFGKIDRDSKCEGVGSCGNDDTANQHREVLTGVAIDADSGFGTGASSPKPWTANGVDYTHSSVTLFLNNTSSNTMTITGATVSWTNTDARLKNITLLGGRSLVLKASNAVSASGATSAAVTLTTPVEIPANRRYVPITFEFKDSSGFPVNMRSDEISVSLIATNNSTGTTSCTSTMTVSEAVGSIVVPGGPGITSVKQNQPASGTSGYAV